MLGALRYIAAVMLMTAVLPVSVQASVSQSNEKMNFWATPQDGTNQFNQTPTEKWFKAAADADVEWVRITFSKWDSQSKDFLAGNLDNYQSLVPEDLAKLKEVIGWAEKYQLKVVLAPLGLPGSRWAQNNSGKRDLRLWNDKKWWEQSSRYWKDIATALKGNKTIVAYNIINEPIAEMGTGLAEHGDPSRYDAWYKKYQGTSHDLPAFYNKVIAAIREVDKNTPVMVDAGWYAQAPAFTYWPKLEDNKVLYAFHMYEPFDFTNRKNFLRKKNGKKMYTYPGKIPYAGKEQYWDEQALENWLNPFFDWAKTNNIPANHLVASEFGAYRKNPGTAAYMEDLLSIFERKGVHWGFYSFREDEWDGYDYEMGNKPLGWKYWQAVEKGESPDRPWNQTNKIWKVLDQELKDDTITATGKSE
ncbi:glycoside hydrolase family 5 protein [Sansalvadorimonas sp. 2012CJ34-2]|uniref:Glycoside hydrolase family 5 protein n=1 Tax=Parendozoicomonas callyspongiae TaxID=2942213 RepID=A0ABT0PD23_9GAMM|nr:cellulase family glycosylhydrolase [Sansalvadorimonas sp. 2012CJ34-2]MCL6269274.1 glycoside hydrolase family 5 protein [Sansalvadorimonas sp. 2012CJ34-2]